MRKTRFDKNKGILFWITGLSGSGKTTLANKIEYFLSKKYGPFLNLSGDELRSIFNYNKFDKKSRYKYALTYSNQKKKILQNETQKYCRKKYYGRTSK